MTRKYRRTKKPLTRSERYSHHPHQHSQLRYRVSGIYNQSTEVVANNNDDNEERHIMGAFNQV